MFLLGKYTRVWRISVALMAMLLVIGTLSGCIAGAILYGTGKAAIELPGDIATLTNHSSAKKAMERNDVGGAIRILSRSHNQRKEISGGPSWGELNWKAAILVVQAHDQGHDIDDKALLRAYQVLSQDDDLISAVHFQELSGPLVAKTYGNKSTEVLKLAMDQKAILLAYLRAGGWVDLNRSLDVSTMVIIDARQKRPGVRMLGYEPDLLISFPLRLSRTNRELFFERNNMTLLPRGQWHDEVALKSMMLTDDYLFWLEDHYWASNGTHVTRWRTPAAIYSNLTQSITMIRGWQHAVSRMQAQGFDVRYGKGPYYTEGEWKPRFSD